MLSDMVQGVKNATGFLWDNKLELALVTLAACSSGEKRKELPPQVAQPQEVSFELFSQNQYTTFLENIKDYHKSDLENRGYFFEEEALNPDFIGARFTYRGETYILTCENPGKPIKVRIERLVDERHNTEDKDSFKPGDKYVEFSMDEDGQIKGKIVKIYDGENEEYERRELVLDATSGTTNKRLRDRIEAAYEFLKVELPIRVDNMLADLGLPYNIDTSQGPPTQQSTGNKMIKNNKFRYVPPKNYAHRR